MQIFISENVCLPCVSIKTMQGEVYVIVLFQLDACREHYVPNFFSRTGKGDEKKEFNRVYQFTFWN